MVKKINERNLRRRRPSHSISSRLTSRVKVHKNALASSISHASILVNVIKRGSVVQNSVCLCE